MSNQQIWRRVQTPGKFMPPSFKTVFGGLVALLLIVLFLLAVAAARMTAVSG